jgi:hypothetical protein
LAKAEMRAVKRIVEVGILRLDLGYNPLADLVIDVVKDD